MSKLKQAIILAAGYGKRLLPLTFALPKPLLPIRGRPIIYWIIKWLIKNEIEEIIIKAYYKKSLLKFFIDLENVKIFEEKILYGRAYFLKQIENYLDKDFLVVDGDTITSLNLKDFYRFHKKTKSLLSITVRRKYLEKGGRIILGKNNVVKGFEEVELKKPVKVLSNCGIEIFSRKCVKYINYPNEDISIDLIPKIVKMRKVYAYYLSENYFWKEYGNIKKYFKYFWNAKI